MTTATYKFTGVPKTFTSRAAALRFLANSPGYVKRRNEYLRTYWPGLMQELEAKKKTSNKPVRARGQLAASALANIKTSGPGLADAADAIRDWAGDQVEQAVGTALYGGRGTNRASAVPARVQHASKVAEKVVPSPHTVETASDWTLGKGLTNLAQGQGPKNWQDVAGLGVGVAGILPIGKSVKGAAALRAAFKGEKAADAAKAAKAVKGTPLGPKTLNETVQDALSGVDEAIAAKNAINSQERAKRATGGMKAYLDAGGGLEGIKASRGELKGAFPDVEWNGVTAALTPETADAMIRNVADNPEFGYYDLLHVGEGMERALSGRNVQQHQLDAIRRALGGNVAEALTNAKNRSNWKLLYNAGVKIWNIPRAVQASYDLSAPFRQALVAATRHPRIFARNFKPMVKSAGSAKVTREIAEEIPTRANFKRYGIAELKFTDMLGMREEQWPGSYVDNFIGIKQSARAYSTFLNKMRADVFDHLIDVAQAHGKNIDDPEFLKKLGEHVMNSTGRGKIPGGDAGEAAATFLNNFLFSPRLLASRFQILNPYYYGKLAVGPKKDWFVLKQAAESLATTMGGVSVMLYLASNIPGVKVGTNPLSSDFGKIRIGDTRIDLMGGFQPLIVLYSRWYKNEYVSSASGKKTKLGEGYGIPMRGDLFLRFMESKMAPSPRLIWDLANGENFVGEPMTPKNVAINTLVPLNIQGARDVYNSTGGNIPATVGGGLLGSIGFGVNSYPDKAAPGGVASVRSSTRRSNPFRPSTRSNPFRP